LTIGGTVGFVLLASAASAQSADEIVRRSVEIDNRNSEAARNYTFLERSEQRELDSDGRIKRRTIRTHDVTLLEGSPYRRLVARDDKPLPPEEERKEQDKLQKSIEQRQKETPDQRSRRIAEWKDKRRREREQFHEIVDAFQFHMAGEELIAGRPVWAITATPRPAYRGQSRIGKLLPKFSGKLWIDKQDYQWVKAEAEALDTISFGFFLARLQKGARISFEQTRVNNDVWLPKSIQASGAARIALVKLLRTEIDVRFSDYRKFETESRITSVQERPGH
jgi:hypothetical protein